MPRKTQSNKEFSFSDLNVSLTKINPEGDILSNSKHAKIDDYISLGNYTLNAQVSGDMFRGIPNGRVTMLAGESGCLVADEYVDVYIMKSLNVSRNINTNE